MNNYSTNTSAFDDVNIDMEQSKCLSKPVETDWLWEFALLAIDKFTVGDSK